MWHLSSHSSLVPLPVADAQHTRPAPHVAAPHSTPTRASGGVDTSGDASMTPPSCTGVDSAADVSVAVSLPGAPGELTPELSKVQPAISERTSTSDRIATTTSTHRAQPRLLGAGSAAARSPTFAL